MSKWMLGILGAAGLALVIRRELPAIKRELKIIRM